MPKPVKTKRPYRSARRESQANATHTAVLDAARALFAGKGWAGTTIAAIARKAGVAPETVYARFGNKRAIAHALVVAAMRGDQPDTPFMEQKPRQAVQRLTDPKRMIDGLAGDLSDILQRVSPILAVVRTAAETDPEMRDLYGELHELRQRNFSTFVARLAELGALRKGLGERQATDHVWSLASPEMFLLWTGVGGAGPEAHRKWLAGALKRLLLKDD